VPLNLEGKKEVVSQVNEQLAKAQTVVFAEYSGVPVQELSVLRVQARAAGVYLRVIRNTLARRAVQGTPFAPLAEQMVGPLIYGISADPIAAPKVLHEFAKSNDKIVIKAGSYAGEILDRAQIAKLASIPSREELLAKLVGVMQAPVASFARVLGAIAQKRASEEAAG
jgi:large subunit ribosomal protein L10